MADYLNTIKEGNARCQFSLSVVIPAYNAEKFISKTLESALSQTVLADEIIVVDDGSSDGTVSVVEKFPVSLICQKNGGPAQARNSGILASRGEWIAFLDHDDVWHPRKTEVQLSLIEEGVNAVFCPNTEISREITFEDMFWRNHGGNPSASIIRRETLIELGMFCSDPRMIGVDDYNFWLKFFLAGLSYRVSPRMYSFTPAEGHYSGNPEKMLSAELYNIDEIGKMAHIEPRKIQQRKFNVRLEYLPSLIYNRKLISAREQLFKLGFNWRTFPYLYALLPQEMIDIKRQIRKFLRRFKNVNS